jgi:two-component system, cell cycle response regulator DivK
MDEKNTAKLLNYLIVADKINQISFPRASSRSLQVKVLKMLHCTILVVEDFDDSREMLSTFLNVQGYETLEAADGQEAVDIAYKEHPDLILMDLSLPVLDGIEAARQIHLDPSSADIPIIALTAHSTHLKNCKENALAAGCVDYLEKPFDFSLLENKIKTHIH